MQFKPDLLAGTLQYVLSQRYTRPNQLELRRDQLILQHIRVVHPGLRPVQHHHQPRHHRHLGAGRLQDPASAYLEPRRALRQRSRRIQLQLRPNGWAAHAKQQPQRELRAPDWFLLRS